MLTPRVAAYLNFILAVAVVVIQLDLTLFRQSLTIFDSTTDYQVPCCFYFSLFFFFSFCRVLFGLFLANSVGGGE